MYHGSALRIVYQDIKSSFEELLKKDKSVPVYIKYIYIVFNKEIFKVKNSLFPIIMNEVYRVGLTIHKKKII